MKKLTNKKYRKKPVVVEAMKFGISARSQRLCREFVGDAWVYDVPRLSPMMNRKRGIKTLEGIMAIDVGDYIIKGVQGEFYPCKPDIFHATYEEVSEDD